MGKFKDLSGQRFGRLLVLNRIEKNDSYVWFLCRCDCNNENTIRASSLKDGTTKSCGCISKEINFAFNSKHGEGMESKEYRAWSNMKDRCYNKKHVGYKHYGLKGIVVCESWKDDYVQFLSDMGRAPSAKHSIDRIDNNKGYHKSNCRWATAKEQCNNRSNNVILTFNGQTKSAREWSKEIGLPYTTIMKRLDYGWTVERTLTQEFRKAQLGIPKKFLTFNGQTKSIKEWSEENGMPYETIISRLRYGWSVEKTLTLKKL